jgi:hypothetical protein
MCRPITDTTTPEFCGFPALKPRSSAPPTTIHPPDFPKTPSISMPAQAAWYPDVGHNAGEPPSDGSRPPASRQRPAAPALVKGGSR